MSRWAYSDVEGTLYFYGVKPAASFSLYRMESGTSDNAVAITYQLTTKRFDFGMPYTQKIGYVLSAIFLSTDQNTLTISVAKDGGGYSSLGTVASLTGSIETLPQEFPFFLGAGGALVRKVVHLEGLDRWFDIQFKFSNYTLDSDTQLLNFTIMAYPCDVGGDSLSDSFESTGSEPTIGIG